MANPYNVSDVFLSYSRQDSEFVHKLFNLLKEQGKDIWADFEDIPKAAYWQLIWHDPSYTCELSCFERRVYLDDTSTARSCRTRQPRCLTPRLLPR